MNDHEYVSFKAYPDYLPTYEKYDDIHSYFPADIYPTAQCINVLITLYDEDVSDLKATLAALGCMFPNVQRKVRVLIAQDGWIRASDSVKKYFRDELCCGAKEDWNDLDMAAQASVCRTFIIQPIDDFTGDLLPTRVSETLEMDVSLLIKTDNRMKHNSHSWFYRGFCKEYPSDYLFMTDVGTTFDDACLQKLEAFMDANSGVAGCHGYPWVAKLGRGASWIQRYLRAMQEYELGPLATDHDRGFQSMFGFQQTLSGPCTMLRTEDATYPSLLSFMSSVLERSPSELTILKSNLNIVEDTAMTLYLFATSGKMMALVPDAYYYYDVETTPMRFLAQRRRWMNGVGSGLLLFWKTYHKVLKRSKHTRGIRILVRAILMVGICTQVIFPFVQPVLIGYVIFQAFNPGLCAKYPHMLRSFQETWMRPYFPVLPCVMTGAYVATFVAWVGVHAHTKKRAYVPTMFWVVFSLSHTIVLYSYYLVLIVTLQVAFMLLPVWQRPIAVFFVGMHYMTPVIIAGVKKDVTTLKTSMFGIVPYLCFFPMWAFMYGYNIARLWDVTWGNRTGMLDSDFKEKADYRRSSHRVTYTFLAFMVAATAGCSYMSTLYDASQFHVLYVAPWYFMSAIMGLISIVWVLTYKSFYKKLRKWSEASVSTEEVAGLRAPSLFRYNTVKRLQRAFTFGRDRAVYLP